MAVCTNKQYVAQFYKATIKYNTNITSSGRYMEAYHDRITMIRFPHYPTAANGAHQYTCP